MPPTAPQIMIIRHAEKPTDQIAGVDASGTNSKHSLIVQGWQRAGAIVSLFAPARGALQAGALAKPQFIFASASKDDPVPGDSKSNRPQETVTPLAQLLGIDIDLSLGKGDEVALAQKAQTCTGPVLIAWQHENINAIANAIAAGLTLNDWPKPRFDMVYVFTLDPAGGTYTFTQVPQLLLAGDIPDLIS